MVRLVGTRDYGIKSFHVPTLGPPRSEWIAAAGFGMPDGGLPVSMADGVYDNASVPPEGFPHGTVTGIDALLGWTINQRRN
jgi:hypothetical protein